MAQWEGFGVSVRCGSPLGCYQGTILAADGASITLTKPFRNGFPYPKAQVTLKASDIKSLEIISGRSTAGTAHSTVPMGTSKRRAPRATVGESLQPPVQVPVLPTVPVPSAPPAPNVKSKPARSKPIDIQGTKQNKNNNTHAGSYGASGSTPKSRAPVGEKARRRNEACFGSAALEALDDDFDFEGNLALFDKEALWQQMRPDVVRVAAARDELAGGKLRHDQNVLRPARPDPAPVCVPPGLRGPRDYVTDAGTRLPSVGAQLRARLWAELERCDDDTRHAARALLARAAADVALRLVGGTRRLDPRNAHQRPRAGVAVGRGCAAAAAVTAARLLLSHGVDTYVLPLDESCAQVSAALGAYRACAGRVLRAQEPRPAADLLLLALHEPHAAPHPSTAAVLEWAAAGRGALVLLEPGGAGCAGARAVLCALLPPALQAPAPRLLLANVAPPPQLFTQLGITYRSPFGAASVLPLHLADDDD